MLQKTPQRGTHPKRVGDEWQLPDDVLAKLAELAEADPKVFRDAFPRGPSELSEDARANGELRAGGASIDEIIRSSRELRRLLQRFADNEAAQAFAGGEFTSAAVALIPQLSRVAENQIAQSIANRILKLGRGRPRGVRGYPRLHRLIADLQLSALMAGGNYTVEKHAGRGTLIKALELLRPHLTACGFRLPSAHEHPLQTYERILQRFRPLRHDPVAGLLF